MNSSPTWTTLDPVSNKSRAKQTKVEFISPVRSTSTGRHAKWQEGRSGTEELKDTNRENWSCSSKCFVCHRVTCSALSWFLLSFGLPLRYLVCPITIGNLRYYGFVVYFNSQMSLLFYLCFLFNIDLAVLLKVFAESLLFFFPKIYWVPKRKYNGKNHSLYNIKLFMNK